MFYRFILLSLLSAILWAQKQTPHVVNGRPISQAELDAVLNQAPPQLKSVVSQNPDELLRYYGTMDRLAEMAEKEKFADQSPYKEQLAVVRKAFLAQSFTNWYLNAHPVTAEDEQKYYDEHREDFTLAHVKGLCVQIRTTAEGDATKAKAEAEAVAEQLRKGADFDALATKHPLPSGFNNSIGKNDRAVPEAIRAMVFTREPGEVTPPIPLANGVYIFRMEKLEVKPLTEVRTEVNNQAASKHFAEWLDTIRKTVEIKLGSQ